MHYQTPRNGVFVPGAKLVWVPYFADQTRTSTIILHHMAVDAFWQLNNLLQFLTLVKEF
mgnify:FL=1